MILLSVSEQPYETEMETMRLVLTLRFIVNNPAPFVLLIVWIKLKLIVFKSCTDTTLSKKDYPLLYDLPLSTFNNPTSIDSIRILRVPISLDWIESQSDHLQLLS